MFIDGSCGGNFRGWKGRTPKSPREITLKKNKIQTFLKGDGGRGQEGLRIRQHGVVILKIPIKYQCFVVGFFLSPLPSPHHVQ